MTASLGPPPPYPPHKRSLVTIEAHGLVRYSSSLAGTQFRCMAVLRPSLSRHHRLSHPRDAGRHARDSAVVLPDTCQGRTAQAGASHRSRTPRQTAGRKSGLLFMARAACGIEKDARAVQDGGDAVFAE